MLGSFHDTGVQQFCIILINTKTNILTVKSQQISVSLVISEHTESPKGSLTLILELLHGK